jgi:hypothetical protein
MLMKEQNAAEWKKEASALVGLPKWFLQANRESFVCAGDQDAEMGPPNI